MAKGNKNKNKNASKGTVVANAKEVVVSETVESEVVDDITVVPESVETDTTNVTPVIEDKDVPIVDESVVVKDTVVESAKEVVFSESENVPVVDDITVVPESVETDITNATSVIEDKEVPIVDETVVEIKVEEVAIKESEQLVDSSHQQPSSEEKSEVVAVSNSDIAVPEPSATETVQQDAIETETPKVEVETKANVEPFSPHKQASVSTFESDGTTLPVVVSKEEENTTNEVVNNTPSSEEKVEEAATTTSVTSPVSTQEQCSRETSETTPQTNKEKDSNPFSWIFCYAL